MSLDEALHCSICGKPFSAENPSANGAAYCSACASHEYFARVESLQAELEGTRALWDAAKAEAELVRKALWLGHGHNLHVYGDDGEMQCIACMRAGEAWDYRHDTIYLVVRAFTAAVARKGANEGQCSFCNQKITIVHTERGIHPEPHNAPCGLLCGGGLVQDAQVHGRPDEADKWTCPKCGPVWPPEPFQ